MRYSPFLSCRAASRLITDGLDRELNVFERVALQVHLKICHACPKVVTQFAQLRRSIGEWREGIEG